MLQRTRQEWLKDNKSYNRDGEQSADCKDSGHYKQRTHLTFDLPVFGKAGHEVCTRSLHTCKMDKLNVNILFQIEVKQKRNIFYLEMECTIKTKGNIYLYHQLLHR